MLSKLSRVEVIDEGRGVRIRSWLKRNFGGHHWRKMKGFARVELDDGSIIDAEIHWFQAHGVGKVRWKIKQEIL